jgi:phage terminase large subunit
MNINIDWRVPPVFRPLLGKARFLGAWGGRGSGKSHFVAGLMILRMLEGKNVLCVREIQNSIADSVKRLLEAKIVEFGLDASFETTEREIRCKLNGAICIFRGMQTHNAASVKSLEGFDIAWWEEAQTAAQSSLDLLIPTIRRPGSQLIFTWNPVSETDPVDVLLRVNPPDNAIVVKVNWQDNPWFPEELRSDMERDRARDPGKYQHIWEGAYRTLSEARIFRNWRVGTEKVPGNAVWFYGVDFGFAVDPAAAVRCCLLDRNTLYIDREAWEVGVPTEALPAFLHKVDGIEAWPSRADSARPETIDYLQRHGFPKMRAARKGAGSVEDGIQFLQGLDIIVDPSCVNMQRELATYAYRTDKRTNEILPVPEDANNHLIDALRYATERLHRKGILDIPPPREPSDRLARPRDYAHTEEGADEWRIV